MFHEHQGNVRRNASLTQWWRAITIAAEKEIITGNTNNWSIISLLQSTHKHRISFPLHKTGKIQRNWSIAVDTEQTQYTESTIWMAFFNFLSPHWHKVSKLKANILFLLHIYLQLLKLTHIGEGAERYRGYSKPLKSTTIENTKHCTFKKTKLKSFSWQTKS